MNLTLVSKDPIRSGGQLGQLVLTMLMSCATVVTPISPDTNAQIAVEDDFFYSNGRKYTVTVSLDSLGVLVREGVSADRIDTLVSPLGLRSRRVATTDFYVYEVHEVRSRGKLVELARQVKEAGDGLIAQVGLVIRTADAVAPMLVSDDFIAQFHPSVTRDQIEALNDENAVAIVTVDPFATNQFLLRVTEASQFDALSMANVYHENGLTVFAHPNFIQIIVQRGRIERGSNWVPDRARIPQLIPNDPLFPNQWHHNNTGQGGGTVDADIDSPEAWDFTQGAAGIVIAVLDNGFDMTHPDLTPNYWTNGGEVPGNGVDDDANGRTDDVSGWDFTGCDAAPGIGCGDNNPSPRPSTFDGNRVNDDDHGTAVAGSAAARGNNLLGVTGSCMNCGLMPLRINFAVGAFSQAQAFGYAQQMGAEIITNSWGYAIGTPIPMNVSNAINAAAGAGSIIFWAQNNPNVNDCLAPTPDLSSLATVVAVSRSSNRDRFDLSGFGNCMDLLAPSASGGTGTLWATTTDRQGTGGYNNNNTFAVCPSAEPGPPPANARDYTMCFNGTSFATPLTAGVAGLILSASAGMTRVQVQRLLQDTADRIEDSRAAYADNTGFSAPATGVATHGYGRVNAFEAVRIAAPVAQGGKAGVDVFLRDNRLDWGNTEQPSNTLFEPTRGYIGHWRSMDVKVDAGPVYETPPTASTFDAFVDETPSAVVGDVNRVYVRVRNRGPVNTSSVTVKLHWTQFGTALPALPSDFWTAWPGDSTDPTSKWTPLQCSTGSSTCTITNLAYSGSSVAGTGADAAQIVQFDFPAPVIDPLLSNHFCLLAMIDSPQDRILPLSRPTVAADFVADALTPTDNNTTHRNYHNLSTTRSTRFAEGFLVRNPTNDAIRAALRLIAPQDWKIDIDALRFDEPFSLSPDQEILVPISVEIPEVNVSGAVTINQERVDVQPARVMGGLTYQFRGAAPPSIVEADGLISSYLVGTFDNRRSRSTALHIVNPTAEYRRALVALFDDKENPLTCIVETLSPNDLWEVEVSRYVQGDVVGVVKIVSLRKNEDIPEPGLVGYQRHTFTNRFLFVKKKSVAETLMHPVPTEILRDELNLIWNACE